MGVIDQSKIARNTILLYVRMGILMLVSFYTSRVVLDALGAVDNGIYGTIAGLVTTFAFMNNTMATACQRFFGMESGRGNFEELRRTFSLCVLVFIFIALIVVFLSETLGLWLVSRKIDAADRLNAARVIFQFSIISFFFTIIMTPFQAMVVINEKMKVYTYISFFEAFGYLAIAFAISRTSFDRLVLYGFLMLAVNAGVSLFYIAYCNAFWKECRFRFYWNRAKFLEIFSFAGWNMVGSLSNTCKNQGITVLINLARFGNVIVSANVMASKLYMSVQKFSENFMIALKPQMIKSYASGDKEGMFKLLYQGSKFSYFLLFIITLPILLETEILLGIWLKDDVTDYTILFTRLLLINSLIEVFVSPLATSMQAYGKIRNYQLTCGVFLLLILPVSWLLYKVGAPVQSVFYVSITICAMAVLLRLVMIRHYLKLNIMEYAGKVLLPVLSVTLLSIPVPLLLEYAVRCQVYLKFVTVSCSAILVTAVWIYVLGLSKSERKHINNKILHLFK